MVIYFSIFNIFLGNLQRHFWHLRILFSWVAEVIVLIDGKFVGHPRVCLSPLHFTLEVILMLFARLIKLMEIFVDYPRADCCHRIVIIDDGSEKVLLYLEA